MASKEARQAAIKKASRIVRAGNTTMIKSAAMDNMSMKDRYVRQCEVSGVMPCGDLLLSVDCGFHIWKHGVQVRIAGPHPERLQKILRFGQRVDVMFFHPINGSYLSSHSSRYNAAVHTKIENKYWNLCDYLFHLEAVSVEAEVRPSD